MESRLTRRGFASLAAAAAVAATASVALAGPGGEHGGSHGPGGEHGGSGEGSGDSNPTAAVTLLDGDAIVGDTFEATEQDQSVFEAYDDVIATIEDVVIQKTDGAVTSNDDSSFRGVNAAVRVYGNADVTIKNCTVSANADGATGIFAYENGIARVSGTTVDVTGDGAGGVQVAGGGTLIGENLTVTSASKAAIRSDRGGGTIDITGGTYTSTGSNGCPAIYSTADIHVRDAVCTSTNSRAVIIEGKNSVALERVELSGNDQSTKEGSVHANVLLYQSMSGDASEGTSYFSMTEGSMACESGAAFYCTNTASVVELRKCAIELSADGGLLIVSAGRWGRDGENGGDCAFAAYEQKLAGGIYVDEISHLDLSLAEGSVFEGSINPDGDAGWVKVALDDTSSWKLDADSHISEFEGDLGRVDANGFALYVGGEGVL